MLLMLVQYTCDITASVTSKINLRTTRATGGINRNELKMQKSFYRTSVKKLDTKDQRVQK